MLKAVVDLGSKAARLLVADTNRSTMKIHTSRGFLTLLGQNVDYASLRRLDQALKNFSGIIYKNGIGKDQVFAFGTEVFRQNPRLKKRVSGYFPKFKIITGQEEARYSFVAGILSQIELAENERVAVVDQGGGSLEIGLGYRFEDLFVIEKAMSFPGFGTFNYPENHRRFSEELLLNFATKCELEKLKPRGIKAIIGMGSVVTQLAFLQTAEPEYRIEQVNGSKIRRLDLAKRVRKHRSLGAFVSVLDYYDKDEILVSGWGTRHGALFSDRILVRKI